MPKKKEIIQYSAGFLSGLLLFIFSGFVILSSSSLNTGNDFIGNNWTINRPTPTPTKRPTTTPTPSVVTTPITTPTAQVTPAPLTQLTLKDPSTGQAIFPRGTNYIRIGNVYDPFAGRNTNYHATFDNGFYNSTNVNNALAKMRNDGYNTVRVFVSDNSVGDNSGNGLNTAYMNNVLDFLNKANVNQISVIFTLLFLPKAGGSYYYSSAADKANAEDVNWLFLTRSGIDGKKRYVKDFINFLKNKSAPMGRIFSIELENELHYIENKKPLSQTSGNFTSLNGVTYNMGSQASKNQMMDASLATWLNEMTDTVKALLPNVLVSCGFLSPYSVLGPDPRIIRTYWAMVPFNQGGSKLDYVELHLYPQPDFSKTLQELATFEIPAVRQKPIVFGEIGLFTGQFSNLSQGAQAIKSLMNHLCTKSLTEGYLIWTWDTSSSELPETYNMLQNSEAVNNVVKPKNLPNPC